MTHHDNNTVDFEKLLSKYKNETQIVKRIPKKTRTTVAQKLILTINNCVEKNTVSAWQDLFFFSFRFLSTVDKKKDKRSLTSKIESNVNNDNKEIVTMKPPNRKGTFNSKYIESKVYEGNIRGAVRILLSNDVPCNYDKSTHDKLKEKHPYVAAVTSPDAHDENHESVEVDTAEIAEILVKVDVKNAFNSVRRDVMLNTIKEKVPEIFPYLYQCYANHSNLYLGDWIILSALGCQQGDPLVPPIFCLAINECVQHLRSELNLWLME